MHTLTHATLWEWRQVGSKGGYVKNSTTLKTRFQFSWKTHSISKGRAINKANSNDTKKIDATNSQPIAHVHTTYTPYLKINGTCYTVSDASSTKETCGNSGRKKAPKFIWSGNSNEGGRKTTPPGYALEIIDEETGKEMEYRNQTKHTNK